MSSDSPRMPVPPAAATPAPRRAVAIVGRPNVGKSALFNRLLRRRVAIVHDESGVTRDRIVCEAVWEGRRLELIDTGGLRLAEGEKSADEIEAGVRDQVAAAIEDAAVVILVVDGRGGLHPLDAEAARLVRRSGRPCHVAVNKCDLPGHDHAVADFAVLGFPAHPVSAEHDRGCGELIAAVLPHLPPAADESAGAPLRVAVVGRPNAGKSSYINRLLRSPRVIVSAAPGTTRDSIEVPFTIGSGPQARRYRLIDTAGLRRARRIDSPVECFSLFRAERSIREADVVALIIDAAAGPSAQDKHIADIIRRRCKGCLLIVNKWDLAMEQGVTQTAYEAALRAAMPFLGHCPVVFVSARSGYNVRRSVEAIDRVAARTRAVLPTGILNRVIAEAVARVQPPGKGRRRLRIYYAAQTGQAPVMVRLFVNDPALMTVNYADYLVRVLRTRFGLEGAPVLLGCRERTRPSGRERGKRRLSAESASH
jgi:GTP-binding protein